MRYDTILHNNLTKSRFGYIADELPELSHKLVVVECTNCHSIIEREFRNANRKHQCSVVVGSKKRCFKCSQWKDLLFFHTCKKLSGGVAKICKECYNKYDAVIKYEINRRHRLKHSFYTNISLYIKKRSYQIINLAKTRNIPCNIDYEYLLNLWTEQHGRCYYSGLDMKADGKIKGFQGWLSPSLDRKTPETGYTKGNVVWCCFAINSFKQSKTEAEFLDIVKQIKWRNI